MKRQPDFADEYADYVNNVCQWMGQFKDGDQNIYVLHPACSSEEAYLFANQWFANGIVQHEREFEYRLLTDCNFAKWLKEKDIRPITFAEAKKLYK